MWSGLTGLKTFARHCTVHVFKSKYKKERLYTGNEQNTFLIGT